MTHKKYCPILKKRQKNSMEQSGKSLEIDSNKNSTGAGGTGVESGDLKEPKKKKVNWQTFPLSNDALNRNTYSNACMEWANQRLYGVNILGSDSNVGTGSSYDSKVIPLPSSIIHEVKMQDNCFPTLNKGVPPLPCDNQPQANIQLRNGPIHFLFPNQSTFIPCTFCSKQIPTLEIKNFYYSKSWPSHWFVCCELCKP